jgi:ketosteroid isomerase-like protein
VLDAQVSAWNRGDLAGYMAGYARTEGLVFTSGGKIRRGWQATFDAFQQRYAKDPAAMGKLSFEVISIDPLGADGAVVLGHWVLTGSPSDGAGIFSVVLERRPEGWKIIHDHTSSAAP